MLIQIIPILMVLLILSVYMVRTRYEAFDDINPNKRFVAKENIDAINNYPETPYFVDPLATSTFKPECCPSTYTTSHGCLCYEPKNYGLIVTRGGNRVIIPA